MVAGLEHALRGADLSGVSLVSVTAWPGVDGVDRNAGSVTVEDVDWLVAHLAGGGRRGDTDLDTANRLQPVLNGISSQTRRHLVDILVDSIGRSAA